MFLDTYHPLLDFNFLFSASLKTGLGKWGNVIGLENRKSRS